MINSAGYKRDGQFKNSSLVKVRADLILRVEGNVYFCKK